MSKALFLSEEFYYKKLQPLANDVERYLLEEVEVNKDLEEMYTVAVQGGMRFRPVLQNIGYLTTGGKDPKMLVPYAASLELMHKASLIHDDLIDQDYFRRGRPSFYNQFGFDKAIAMGDYLVALSLRVLLENNPPQLYLHRFIKMHELLCEGELLEVSKVGKRVSIQESKEISLGKTASLIQFSLSSGAILNGARESEISALDEFGLHLGLVFQVINDLNNLSGLDKHTKGAALTDLQKRRASVPLAMINDYFKENDGQSLWERLDSLEEKELLMFLDSLKASAYNGELKEKVVSFCQLEMSKARKALSNLPQSEMKKILESIEEEMFASWFWQVQKGSEANVV